MVGFLEVKPKKCEGRPRTAGSLEVSHTDGSPHSLHRLAQITKLFLPVYSDGGNDFKFLPVGAEMGGVLYLSKPLVSSFVKKGPIEVSLT